MIRSSSSTLQKESYVTREPALLLVLFALCYAQDDGEGSGDPLPEWLQYKIEVATEAQTGDETTASSTEESVEEQAESASDSTDCLDDPYYCPTEYEGSAMPESVEMLDAAGSDESLRDQASSGFDAPGTIVVEESSAVYEDEDGVTVLIPVESPPVKVEE